MSASSSDPTIAYAADSLANAARSGVACAPVAPDIQHLGVAGAYAAQELQTERALKEGRRIAGRKIGLTSAAVQKQLGVEQPDYGMLFADMGYGDGEEIPLSRLLQPKVEAEIAFVLGRDLRDPAMGLGDVVQAIAYAVPAIEVVDSRIRDWKITLLDTIADNASSGAFVLGGSPKKVSDLDLRLCGMTLEAAGEPVSVGCGAACLGNPLNAVVWLGRKMIEVGRPLAAGEIILSGALGPMAAVEAGGVYEARISGLGCVRAAFSQE